MVPALNEAASLGATIETIRQAIAGRVADHEILIFDDGSTDATGAIADDLARHDPKISVTHHLSPRGLGYCYRTELRSRASSTTSSSRATTSFRATRLNDCSTA
jgi:glycosyltransferase involved in cell wall biosynthesis